MSAPHGVSFGEAMRVWARVAALSFGGPAGQIAVMHRIIVEEKKWIGENRFLQALNYCTLLPGPEAQQLAMSEASPTITNGAARPQVSAAYPPIAGPIEVPSSRALWFVPRNVARVCGVEMSAR